jgi:hypothetical protein
MTGVAWRLSYRSQPFSISADFQHGEGITIYSRNRSFRGTVPPGLELISAMLVFAVGADSHCNPAPERVTVSLVTARESSVSGFLSASLNCLCAKKHLYGTGIVALQPLVPHQISSGLLSLQLDVIVASGELTARFESPPFLLQRPVGGGTPAKRQRCFVSASRSAIDPLQRLELMFSQQFLALSPAERVTVVQILHTQSLRAAFLLLMSSGSLTLGAALKTAVLELEHVDS